MSDEVKYEDWPTIAKVGTALSHEKFVVKNHKFPKYMGWLVIVIGLLSIDYDVFTSDSSDNYRQFLSGFCYILIGGLNLVVSQYIKWIKDNSSWEERFANSSSVSHRVMNVFIAVLVVVALVVLVKNMNLS